jgi:hypothetical protein
MDRDDELDDTEQMRLLLTRELQAMAEQCSSIARKLDAWPSLRDAERTPLRPELLHSLRETRKKVEAIGSTIPWPSGGDDDDTGAGGSWPSRP